MGNLALCMGGGSRARPMMRKEKKLLQVMKMNDGKLLEFRVSMKVKDLLVNYPNYYVGLFNKATQPLPLGYKLKVGQMYFLFPSFCESINVRDEHEAKENNGAIRIKMVITRNQLQEILSNRVRVETMIVDVDDMQCKNLVDLSQTCSRKLDSITE